MPGGSWFFSSIGCFIFLTIPERKNGKGLFTEKLFHGQGAHAEGGHEDAEDRASAAKHPE